jgi:hypothetical protein
MGKRCLRKVVEMEVGARIAVAAATRAGKGGEVEEVGPVEEEEGW